MNGHRSAVEWLLARGTSATARAEFDHDTTPLHWAALHGHRVICDVLLLGGADRSILDFTFNSTPADWANHNGHVALAEILAR